MTTRATSVWSPLRAAAVALLVLAFAACESATPTLVPVPTNTPVPAPTDTPAPVPTDTPTPAPTNTPTPVPEPTATPDLLAGAGTVEGVLAQPTPTPEPQPTDTPTPTPRPTNTPTPRPAPTNTPTPAPTNTPTPEPAPASSWRTDIATGSGIGDRATDASLTLPDGSTSTIESTAGGKAVLLYFFATW